EGRDAVQGLRSAPAATSDVSVSIARLAETLLTDDTAQQPPPAFHVNVEGTPRDLSPMVYDEVYRIVGEALRNVIRHARASHIAVDIRYDRSSFRLHVRDDGRGIDAATGGRHNDGHYG